MYQRFSALNGLQNFSALNKIGLILARNSDKSNSCHTISGNLVCLITQLGNTRQISQKNQFAKNTANKKSSNNKDCLYMTQVIVLLKYFYQLIKDNEL